MKERVRWIDVLKGILIILVVVGHLEMCVQSAADFKPSGIAYYLRGMLMCVYCVHFYMSAFFFVTGYCTKMQEPLDIGAQLKKDAKTLLLPALIIPRLMSLVTWNMDWVGGGSFWNPFHNLPWFLVAMFWSRLLFLLICKTTQRSLYRFLVSLSLSIVGAALLFYYPQYNILYLFHSFVFTLFIYLGFSFKTLSIRRITLYAIGVLYIIVSSLHYKFTHTVIGICGCSSVSIQLIPSWLMLSVLGTLGIMAVSVKIGHNRILEYLGKNTLVIYLTHMQFLGLTSKVMAGYIRSNNGQAFASIVVVFIMIVGALLWSSLWAYIFNHKYLKWILGHF